MPRSIPRYQDALGAFHSAFAGELRGLIDALPIESGALVLDLACGDGAFAGWLAERVGPGGAVVAADLRHSYLELARATVGDRDGGAPVAFVAADVERSPLRDGAFDLAWCAQSLQSLPDPPGVLRLMARVVRPGGVVAVLEDDAMHRVLLPWPEEVELAARRAEWEDLAASRDRPRDFYIGRRLTQQMRAAGLIEVEVRSLAINRQGALSGDERSYVDRYLAELRDRVLGRIAPGSRAAFDRLTDPSSDAYMPARPDFCLTCLEHVAFGIRPRPG